MSCSYGDIAMAVYEEKAMGHPSKSLISKRFRDDVIALWIHSSEDTNHYLDYLNTIDASGKIRFTMETETENGLEVLDLRLKLTGYNQITVDVYSRPTNSFTYVDPKTCYPSRNINKIPEGIALRLRNICDSDEKYEKRWNEYQNYLIPRSCSPSLVVKQLQKVSQISRDNARKPRSKVLTTDSVKFVTLYNPILPNINSLINNYLPILYTDLDLKEIFPRKCINTVYRRQKNLKEMLGRPCYSKSVNSQVNIITPCNSCDIGKYYLVAERKFTSKATGKAIDFKPCFGVHKSDIKTKMERCCTSRHFNEKCLCSASLFGYVKVQVIEQVFSEDPSNNEKVLCYRERYL